MSPPHDTEPAQASGRATRRGVLASIGTLGLGVVAPTVGRAGRSSDGDDGRAAEGDDGRAATGDDPIAESGALETLVDDVIAEHLGDVTPGATVAIVRGETPRLTKGYGVADVDAGTPVRVAETTFRVGSVGKLVTWTAVMQGVQRGTLDLDVDVNAYLEESTVDVPATDAGPITLRHLGTHTAGFESALDPGIVAAADAVDPLETVLDAHRPARIRPPGAAVGYSNYGAALAGHVVAEAHDTTFEEYVQSEIFEPLGMRHSTFAQPVPESHPGTLAAGHTRTGSSFATGGEFYINMRPAGSLSATATDMARFASAHLGNGSVGDRLILHPETARTMRSVHHVRHPAVNNWRYGFYEYGPPDVNLLAHSGATVSFTSLLVLAPDHDLGIFVNYNSDADERHLATVVDEILEAYGIRSTQSTPTPTTDPGRRNRVERVAGEYSSTFLPESGPMQLADVLARVSVRSSDEGRLRTEQLGGDTREWVETAPFVFREVGGDDVLAFETSNGTADVMNMSNTQQGVYEPVSPHEGQLVTGGTVGGSLSGFALSLLGWGGVVAWRRWKRSSPDTDSSGGAS